MLTLTNILYTLCLGLGIGVAIFTIKFIFNSVQFKRYQAENLKMLTSKLMGMEAQLKYFREFSTNLMTPLHGIIGTVDNLLDTDLSKEQREMAEMVQITSKELRSILIEVMNLHQNQINDVAAKVKRIPKGDVRILLVEDNEVNRIVTVRMLENFGFQVHVVTDGSEAVEEARKTQYHLILMDIQMPKMDGMEATQEIRKFESSERRAIIIGFTAQSAKEDLEKCLQVGMNDYITKPVSSSELVSAIYQWLPTSTLDIGDEVTEDIFSEFVDSGEEEKKSA